ncbi:MAG: carbohydrate-binding family 9-like protein [Victivallales bacterium]|jgi:hypothetical protein|nr:carbohydrate-binding family 9-like protein [Victivallales bacterium]
MPYTINKTAAVPTLEGNWDAPVWQNAETLCIANVRPESSDHRPNVQARFLHDGTTICAIYRVEDQYVRAAHTGFQAPVCRDSCVEFFFQPHAGPGYFNFEFNCGGTFLCSYIRDCTRIGDDGFADCQMLGQDAADAVSVYHSLPETVDPEITEPTIWTLQFAIPISLLEIYAGPLGDVTGKEWTANFYKCGDETSHPHWISWVPVDELNFHLPRCFQPIAFGS